MWFRAAQVAGDGRQGGGDDGGVQRSHQHDQHQPGEDDRELAAVQLPRLLRLRHLDLPFSRVDCLVRQSDTRLPVSNDNQSTVRSTAERARRLAQRRLADGPMDRR